MLAIIFVVEIAVGIAAITFRNDLRDILNSQLQNSMNRQNKVGQVMIESRYDIAGFVFVGRHDGMGHRAEENDVLRNRRAEKLV